MSVPSFPNFQRALQGTPMAREARGIYDAAMRGGINPALVVGIAGAESNFGRAGYARGRNNPYGLMGFRFGNYAQATQKLAQTLNNKGLGYRQAYGKSGLVGMINIYTPRGAANGPNNDPDGHTRNIINIGRKTGGDASRAYISAGAAPAAAPTAGTGPAATGQRVAGGLDTGSLMSLMRQQTQRIRAGQGYDPSLGDKIRQSVISQIGTNRIGGGNVDPQGAPGGSAVGGGGANDFARPLPTKLGGSDYGYSDPEGQGGKHLAKDWFAPGGTPLSSPVSGSVFRVKADKNPGGSASGQIFGGSVYIKANDGKVWVFRHVDNPQNYVGAGRKVRAGQRIGAVKRWSGSAHAHIELYKPGPYEYSPARAMNPHDYFRSRGIS
jgi:hypothetical protein